MEKLLEAGADVVVTAGGLGRYLVDQPVVEAALKRRKRRPILLLDCGVPSDVDPAVDALDEAFRYTLADVEKLAERGQQPGHRDQPRAGYGRCRFFVEQCPEQRPPLHRFRFHLTGLNAKFLQQ